MDAEREYRAYGFRVRAKIAPRNDETVGWAKARLRRAHHLSTNTAFRLIMVGTARRRAFAHPTLPPFTNL